MGKRWELVSKDVDGREIGRQQFWLRRSAERMKAWQDGTAAGTLHFLTPLPEGMPPLYTNEVIRVR